MPVQTRFLRLYALLYALFTLAALGLIASVLFNANTASVVVEWTTASELDTVGFNLYRSESPEGAQKRLNESLIPAAADSLAGSDYHFTDKQARSGRTYFYWLEDVDAQGNLSRNGPIEARADAGGGAATWALALASVFILGWGWLNLLHGRLARNRLKESAASPQEEAA